MGFERIFWIACVLFTAVCVALSDVWLGVAVFAFLVGIFGVASPVMAVYLMRTSELEREEEEEEDEDSL